MPPHPDETPVCEFVITRDVSLGHPERGRALAALNRHHVGKDVVAFTDDVPDGLRLAHLRVHASTLVDVRVRVFADGRQAFEVVSQVSK